MIHLFKRELGKKFDKGKIGVTAENKEKHITLNFDVVVDTYEEWVKLKKRKSSLDSLIDLGSWQVP